MLDYGKPIRTFRDNLVRHGVALRVENGRLLASGQTQRLSPAYQEEIKKRAQLLIELLEGENPIAPPANAYT